MSTYTAIFSEKPWVATVNSHRAKLTSDASVRMKPYFVPSRLMEAAKRELEDMEKVGVIEKSSSSYCSPMMIVSNKDRRICICGNYHRLNTINRSTAEPVKVVFVWLANSKCFTKLELTNGYFQVPLEDSQKVAAFIKTVGLFQYFVLYLVVLIRQQYQFAMCGVQQHKSGVEVFMHDILTHLSTLKENTPVLEQMFRHLQAIKMIVKSSKCKVAQKMAEILDHAVGTGKCTCSEDEIWKIIDVLLPMTKKLVTTLLGLAGYYRAFVSYFTVEVLPLFNWLIKNSPYKE